MVESQLERLKKKKQIDVDQEQQLRSFQAIRHSQQQTGLMRL